MFGREGPEVPADQANAAFARLIGRRYRGDELDALDTPLNAKKIVMPIYPPELYERNLVGNIILRVSVNEVGIADASVITGSADRLFVAAGLDAVRQWRFDPPMRGGRPTTVSFPIRLLFMTAEEKRRLTGGSPGR